MRDQVRKMAITVMSWNIWGGKHMDKIGDFLVGHKAEVIGLQEVLEIHEGDLRNNQAKILADRLGCGYIYCPAYTFKTRRRTYSQGNALLTHLPIKSTACHLLSEDHFYEKNAETEPRAALEAVIETVSGDLRVLVTHLAFSMGFRPSRMRDMQMDKLLPLLGPRTILVGDFNVLPVSAEIRRLGEVMTNADPLATEITWRGLRWKDRKFMSSRLDHIFVSRDLKASSFAIGNSIASDHLPIWAEIET